MRTKLMRGGIIAALTAVLAITAVLIASCPQPVNMEGFDSQYKAPAGYGYVTLRIKDADRSIIPDADQVKFYEVIFTDVTKDEGDNDISDSDNDVERVVATADIGDAKFNLKIGKTYSLVVAAYTGGTSSAPTQKAAEQNLADVTVSSATGATIPVTLAPAMSGSGYLYYNYDVTGVDTLSVATIVATPIPAATATTIDISTTSTGTRTLAAGYYTLDVSITGTYGTYKRREVLAIYGEMQSSLGATDSPIVITDAGLSKTAWTVIFNYNMGTEVTGITPLTKYLVNTGTATVAAPPVETFVGYTLASWHSATPFTALNEVTFPYLVPATGTNLYAQWEEQGAIYDFTITFSEPTDDSGNLAITGGTTISMAFGGSATVAATYTGTEPDTYSWTYNGNEIANTANFTLDADTVFGVGAYNTYYITLHATWDDDNVEGSVVVTVNIAAP